MQQYGLWLTCVVLLVASVGCSSAPKTTAIHGEVSYDGRAIEKGKIDFVPVDGTPGASVVADIVHGRYDVPSNKWGLRSDGVYLVRITAFRKTGRKAPHRIEFGGPPVEAELEENFIPAIYNEQSTLKLPVADLPDKDRADFHLH